VFTPKADIAAQTEARPGSTHRISLFDRPAGAYEDRPHSQFRLSRLLPSNSNRHQN